MKAASRIRVSDDPENDADSAVNQESFGTADANMQRAVVKVVEAKARCRVNVRARGLRHSAAAVLAERLASKAHYHIRQSGVGSRSASSWQQRQSHYDRNTGLAPQRSNKPPPVWANCSQLEMTKCDISFPLPLPDDPRKWQGWNNYRSPNYYERLWSRSARHPSNELIEEPAASSCGGGKKNCRSRIGE